MYLPKKTIFDSSIATFFLHYLSRFLLFILGWRIEGKAPEINKYVLIAAPHTSNWDYFYTLLLAFALKIPIYAMGKKELCQGYLGKVLMWLGLVPIDRTKSNNTVDSAIQAFQDREKMVMVIPPSGTRARVKRWKSGFYHIAFGAGVPISLGYLDYSTKTGGTGKLFTPTGNYEADMIEIKQNYKNYQGKYPDMTLNYLPVEVPV
ncbi:MAG: acyltransferase family protein [Candidatus Magnetoglobus multicellularis str. Araruama]|uniref:Acyltransferase family protein n=1 Tax=Candidatus Magnetoglobus multicellularis str. Araruama TaxID=890399 RepID=A0A1V1NZ74_9BACT|nr:MAG: acyltransferase family protein [Candidatus Magnetoglobus multicellularis str. Araruama]